MEIEKREKESESSVVLAALSLYLGTDWMYCAAHSCTQNSSNSFQAFSRSSLMMTLS